MSTPRNKPLTAEEKITDLLDAIDHPLLRELFGMIEDSGTPESTKLWQYCQAWADVRDSATKTLWYNSTLQPKDRRERIATAALQGFLANPGVDGERYVILTETAVKYAEALIAELDKVTPIAPPRAAEKEGV